MAAPVRAADLKNPRMELGYGSATSTHRLLPFWCHRCFKVFADLKLTGEAVILKVALQVWVKVTDAQHSSALIDFSFERRQQSDFPNAELIQLFQVDDHAHTIARQPASKQISNPQRLVVLSLAVRFDDEPSGCVADPVIQVDSFP